MTDVFLIDLPDGRRKTATTANRNFLLNKCDGKTTLSSIDDVFVMLAGDEETREMTGFSILPVH